jgi:predicted branched-subunit amino acid permease
MHPLPETTRSTIPPFTLRGIRRGVVASQSLAVGVLIYGVAFGLLAAEAKLSLAEALAMSGLVYSGSAQMVAVNAMGQGQIPSGFAAAALLVAIMLLNARYLLYGAALHSWLGTLPPWQSYPTLAVLGDGNWMLSMKAAASGENDAGYVFGSGITMFVPWLAGTWLGMSAGALFSNPAVLGLDFMIVAFAMAMASGLFKGRADLPVLIAAASAASLAHWLLPAGSTILAAGIAGALTAWFMHPAGKQLP